MNQAVAAIVYDKETGCVLVGKKSPDVEGFLSGKYHLPGETLEPGESDEAALVRGIREEAGIELRILQYLGNHRTPKNTLVKWYECEALTKNITASSDLVEAKWVPRQQVPETCDSEAITVWPDAVKDYFR